MDGQMDEWMDSKVDLWLTDRMDGQNGGWEDHLVSANTGQCIVNLNKESCSHGSGSGESSKWLVNQNQ